MAKDNSDYQTQLYLQALRLQQDKDAAEQKDEAQYMNMLAQHPQSASMLANVRQTGDPQSSYSQPPFEGAVPSFSKDASGQMTTRWLQPLGAPGSKVGYQPDYSDPQYSPFSSVPMYRGESINDMRARENADYHNRLTERFADSEPKQRRAMKDAYNQQWLADHGVNEPITNENRGRLRMTRANIEMGGSPNDIQTTPDGYSFAHAGNEKQTADAKKTAGEALKDSNNWPSEFPSADSNLPSYEDFVVRSIRENPNIPMDVLKNQYASLVKGGSGSLNPEDPNFDKNVKRQSALADLSGKQLDNKDKQMKIQQQEDEMAPGQPQVPSALQGIIGLAKAKDPGGLAAQAQLRVQTNQLKGESFIPDWQVWDHSAYKNTMDKNSKAIRQDVLDVKSSSDTITRQIDALTDELKRSPRIPVNWYQEGGSELALLHRIGEMFQKDKGLFNLGVLNGKDLDVLDAINADPTGGKAYALGKDRILGLYSRVKRAVMARRDAYLSDRGLGTIYTTTGQDGRVYAVPSWQSTDIYRNWTNKGI